MSDFAYSDAVIASGLVGWIDLSGVTANFSGNTFGCYLDDSFGRKLMTWNSSNKLGNDGGGDVLSINPNSVDEDEIPEGYYKAILATFDGSHPDSENNEAWYLSFDSPVATYISNVTPDLPDYTTYGEFTVDTIFTVSEDAPLDSSFFAIYDESVDPAPYDSSLVPACLVLDFTCPFAPAPNRRVINFAEVGDVQTSIVANQSQAEAEIGFIQTIAPNQLAGFYNVHLASYDDHSVTAETGEDEENWFIEFFRGGQGTNQIAQSPATPDIDDNDDFATATYGMYVPGDYFESVTAVHNEYPDSDPNSVTPICAAFDYIAQLPTCGLVEGAGGILVTWDNVLSPGGSVSGTIGGSGIIPAGTYDITVQYDDIGHSNGEGTEDNEIWKIDLGYSAGGNFITKATLDLADGVSTFEESLETSLQLLVGDIDSATAVHALSSGAGETIWPTCAVFNPNPPNVNVTLTPQSQGGNTGDTVFIDWVITGNIGGNGCEFSSNPQDSNWDLPFTLTPPTPGQLSVDIIQNGTFTYTLYCEDDIGYSDSKNSIINVPPQCSNGIDDDSDGFCDIEGSDCSADGITNTFGDRGCWDDVNEVWDLTDNDESDDPTCVVNDSCEAYYGENPIICSADCVIDVLEDV